MTYFVIYQPLYNILALLVTLVKGNVGWAIFILAFLIRLSLWPLNRKVLSSQMKLSKIQPKIKEIQNKYKQDAFQANKEIVALFKQEQINPYSPLGGVFLQLAVFIFLFLFFKQVISLTDWTPHLYSFVKINFPLNYQFLNIFDLKTPSLFLSLISAIINMFLILLQPANPGQNKFVFTLLPLITVFYYKFFPAAILVYWVAMSLAGILEMVINKKIFQEQNK